MPALLKKGDRLIVRQIIRHREGIDPRRHAILRRLVAQLDNFLDHLALGLLQRALCFAHLDERLQLLVADPRPDPQFRWGEPIDHQRAGVFEQMPDAIEQRHHQFEGENAQRRDPVRRRKGEQFWDEIAKEDDERKNGQRRDPGWQMGDERAFPNENKAEYDQWHVDHRVAEQEDVEHAARVVAEGPQEICEGGVLLLQTLNLVAFQRKERRLQTGKKRRAVDQENDRDKEKREPDCRHPLPAAVCTTALHWKK